MSELKDSPALRIPLIILAGDINSALPLERTTVNAQVNGPVASVVVTQQFGNPLEEPAELDYLFPLPAEAAVTGFELRIGSRTIQGNLRESESARAAYEEARGQGRRAGLIEQRRPNLFAIRLANVLPGEKIEATARYQQRVKFEDDAYEFVFPMGITPKYDSPEHPGEGEGVHVPVAHGHEPIGPVEINLAVDAGVPVGAPESPSHPIQTTAVDERRFQVRLAGEQIPDRDFVLRYPVAGQQAQASGWCSGEPGKEYFLAVLVPPAMVFEEESSPLPREFIFVLDRSGSMTGEPIKQARNALRACLRTLNPVDTFRILLFDNRLEWFRPEPSAVTQEEIEAADAYLDKVQGRGGTEIVRAIEQALSLPADEERTRFVVFLTDGAVSAESRALVQVRRLIGSARLFTFGIGPSVNRALLSRMAEIGRGRSSFLQLNEDIEGAVIRFQDSVSFPALTDLSFEWQNAQAWDVYPARLPDLYYGQVLEICGRLARSGEQPVRLTLRGKRAGQAVEVDLTLQKPSGQDQAIERVWARARVDELILQQEMEPQRADSIRSEIISLALAHHLATAFTSFVAVDQEAVVSGGQPRIIHVAQPLPQGLDAYVFQRGSQPVQMLGMAFPASLPAAGAAKKVLARAIAPLSAEEQGDTAYPYMIRDSGPKDVQNDERESALRWLARTQKLDGSWDGDGEWTAVALLAFVRSGYTTRTGPYRQVVRRAFRWLVENKGTGFASFLRARALEELAQAADDDENRAAAQAARLTLPQPATALETAAIERVGSGPQEIRTLDDLRMAALLDLSLPVPPDILKGRLPSGFQGDEQKAGLIRTWAVSASRRIR